MLDTIVVEQNQRKPYIDESISIATYIKTQQSDTNQVQDMLHVISVMLNRLNKHNISWNEYYTTPSINNSNTIRLIRTNQMRVSFDMSNSRDSFIHSQVLKVIDAYPNVERLGIEPNLLYFENCKVRPRTNWFGSNYYSRFVHRFYYDTE